MSSASPPASHNSPYYDLHNFDVRIQGTSNVWDWEAKARVVHIDLAFAEKPAPGFFASTLTECVLRLPTCEITSRMPRVEHMMRQALQPAQHPEIIFTLNDIKETLPTQQDDSEFTLTATGTLEIAGVGNLTQLHVTAQTMDDQTVVLRGARTLQMTDFEIVPPTTLLGAIRVRDQIRFTFTLYLRPRE